MRTLTLTTLSALALVACSGGKDSADSGNGGNGANTCEITAEPEYPADGEPNAYYRSAVEFELSEADSTATLALADGGGAAVDGEVSFSEDGETIYFTPAAPLSPSTSYTATLTWCGGDKTASSSFTTSALGSDLATDLVGKTYNIDLASGRFIEPPGVGELLGGLLENSILFGVTSTSDTEITFRGAISETDSTDQDVCNPSLEDFPAADFSESPFFELSSEELTLSIAGLDINIDSIRISGTFAADGSYFGGGELEGELDARDIGPLLKDQLDDTSPDAVCSLLAGFGVTCQACSSDGEAYCATIFVDQLVALEQSGTLVSVAQEDCFEGCADSCKNPECAEASSFAICQ